MYHEIIFDKSSPHFDPRPRYSEFNLLFVKAKINYLRDTLEHRGYIYLNQIYEAFEIKWNYRHNNICFVADNIVKKYPNEWISFKEDNDYIRIKIRFV